MVWNISYFPIYWVANHPNWLSYFSEGWPNHQPEMVYHQPLNMILGFQKPHEDLLGKSPQKGRDLGCLRCLPGHRRAPRRDVSGAGHGAQRGPGRAGRGGEAPATGKYPRSMTIKTGGIHINGGTLGDHPILSTFPWYIFLEIWLIYDTKEKQNKKQKSRGANRNPNRNARLISKTVPKKDSGEIHHLHFFFQWCHYTQYPYGGFHKWGYPQGDHPWDHRWFSMETQPFGSIVMGVSPRWKPPDDESSLKMTINHHEITTLSPTRSPL